MHVVAIFSPAYNTCKGVTWSLLVVSPGCLGDALEATRPYVNGTVGPLVGKDEVVGIHILPGGDLLPGYHPYPTFNNRYAAGTLKMWYTGAYGPRCILPEWDD